MKLKTAAHFRSFLGSQSLQAALILVVVLALFYRDVVFGGKTFLMENTTYGTMPAEQGGGPYGYPVSQGKAVPAPVRDAGAIAWGYEPSSRAARDLVRRGELPLWKNTVGLGSPFLADGMSLPLEPLLMLTYLLPDPAWPAGMDALVLLRFFLAGWFAYLFARRLGLGFAPSVFAGTAYMLGFQVITYGNSPLLPVTLLIPLLLMVFDRLAERPAAGRMIATALVIAWMIIAGLPEGGFLALMMGGLWYLYQSFWQLKQRGFAPSAWLRWGGWGAAATLAGVALSAWYLIPLVENLANSVTNHPVGQGLKTFTLPGLIISFLTPVRALGRSSSWGTVLLGLALAGAFAIPRSGQKARPAAFFAVYALIFGLEMYGIPPFKWIGYLPGYSQVTIPLYMVASLTLALALLAAIALDRLPILRRGWAYLGVASLVAGVIAAGSMGLNQLGISLPPQALLLDLGVTLLLLLGIAFAAFLASATRLGKALPALLLVALLGEVFVVHRHLARPDRYDPYTRPPYLNVIETDPEPSRILGYDAILHPNLAMAYGVDDLRYLDAIEPARRHLFIEKLIAPGKPMDRLSGLEMPFYTGRILDLLNVRYLLAPASISLDDPAYRLVYDGEVKVYQNGRALPRAFVLHRAELAGGLSAVLDRLANPDFDPLQSALIEPKAWLPAIQKLDVSEPTSWEAARYVRPNSSSIEIQAQSAAPGILVVSETYFPGWRARLDGEPVDLFPVDGLLQGVYLPAGAHRVTLEYRPSSFVIGTAAALITLAVLLVVWVAARRAARKVLIDADPPRNTPPDPAPV